MYSSLFILAPSLHTLYELRSDIHIVCVFLLVVATMSDLLNIFLTVRECLAQQMCNSVRDVCRSGTCWWRAWAWRTAGSTSARSPPTHPSPSLSGYTSQVYRGSPVTTYPPQSVTVRLHVPGKYTGGHHIPSPVHHCQATRPREIYRGSPPTHPRPSLSGYTSQVGGQQAKW